MDNHFYLGIDLDDENAVISYYELNMKEPDTLSTVAGSEVFQIPVLLTKKKGIGQWFIGEEAKKLAVQQGQDGIDRLLERAIKHEKICIEGEDYPAEELLTLYLKKLLLLAGSLGKRGTPDTLVICLAKLSREMTELLGGIALKLGLDREQVILMDRKECFYYFVYHQSEDIYLHDVCLFDYRGEDIRCCRLSRNIHTTPQLITLTEEIRRMDASERDEAFLKVLQDAFRGQIISTSYLVGDGFEGGWMKQSVAFLCKGRRAFVGKNLYSKGACYAAAVLEKQYPWQYVYLGDNEMKVNLCLKVHNRGKLEFFTLISAGDNWYETLGECEVILDGTPEIDFWLQPPNSREAKIEKLELADLPERPNKTSRLRITAKPLSDAKVQIQIKDLGFGELFKGSDKVWEYIMSFEEESIWEN